MNLNQSFCSITSIDHLLLSGQYIINQSKSCIFVSSHHDCEFSPPTVFAHSETLHHGHIEKEQCRSLRKGTSICYGNTLILQKIIKFGPWKVQFQKSWKVKRATDDKTRKQVKKEPFFYSIYSIVFLVYPSPFSVYIPENCTELVLIPALPCLCCAAIIWE